MIKQWLSLASFLPPPPLPQKKVSYKFLSISLSPWRRSIALARNHHRGHDILKHHQSSVLFISALYEGKLLIKYFHDYSFSTDESTLCSEVFVNAPFFISAEDAGAMDARYFLLLAAI
jgi:hypothetical protein